MIGLVSTNFLLIAIQQAFSTRIATSWHYCIVGRLIFPRMGPQSPCHTQTFMSPDWHAPEIIDVPKHGQFAYYESQSIIEKMFREIKVPDVSIHANRPKAHRRRRGGNEERELESGAIAPSMEFLSLNDAISSPLHPKFMSYVHLTRDRFQAFQDCLTIFLLNSSILSIRSLSQSIEPDD